MATGKRDIYCDLSRDGFVASQLSASGASINPFFHQDKVTLAIHPLEPDPTRAANAGPYSQLDPTGWSAVAKVINPTDGSVLASQTSWTVSGNTLVGQMDLNTAAMALVFPSSPLTTTSLAAVFEVELTDGSGGKFTFQGSVTIKREYITAGSPSAIPAATYLTKDECLAMFVRFFGNPNGASITLPSANGTYITVLQCNDDGSNASNV